MVEYLKEQSDVKNVINHLPLEYKPEMDNMNRQLQSTQLMIEVMKSKADEDGIEELKDKFMERMVEMDPDEEIQIPRVVLEKTLLKIHDRFKEIKDKRGSKGQYSQGRITSSTCILIACSYLM